MKKAVRKKKTTRKPKFKGLTMLDKLPKNRGEWLELVIRMTERVITPSDRSMQGQADRLKAELAEWKKQQSSVDAK
jgi:hypothetical protein